jgi:ADP-dependent NAD(P)H-hydrate dehydratase / NAD(P)H-hydrate epimerase
MSQAYWLNQGEEPLFPDLLWSRPETKMTAGKLLIVGGHATTFAAPAQAYTEAGRAGIGSVRVLLPSSLQKTVSKVFPEAEFAPSNPSGGLASSALAELLDHAAWADGVLLSGDIGRNSETVALLESFLGKYSEQVTLTRDIADEFCARPAALVGRSNTLFVIALGQLQKLATNLRWPRAFTSDMSLLTLVEMLHEFTSENNFYIITQHLGNTVVAVNGQVSTTSAPNAKIWRTSTAAHAATWWLQTPTVPFEALTSSLVR